MTWTVLNYLLATGERLPRKKQYKDWTSYIYIADAAHGSALTSEVWKVTKIKLDSGGDLDEMWETDWYDNAANSLVVCQWLSYR